MNASENKVHWAMDTSFVFSPASVAPVLGSTHFLKNIWDYELYLGIKQAAIHQIVLRSTDLGDTNLHANTSDAKRFASEEKLENWYNDTGRFVFTLMTEMGEIVGLWSGRRAKPPLVQEITNPELYARFVEHTELMHTAWVRLYPAFRWKGIGQPFVAECNQLYRLICPDAYICIDIANDNTASQTAFEKCGYEHIWYGENLKSVEASILPRKVYLQSPALSDVRTVLDDAPTKVNSFISEV